MATLKVIRLPNGEIQVFVDGDISFDVASQASKATLARLKAMGIDLKSVEEPEQHKGGEGRHVHILDHQHAGH
jgi:hypothetical protein